MLICLTNLVLISGAATVNWHCLVIGTHAVACLLQDGMDGRLSNDKRAQHEKTLSYLTLLKTMSTSVRVMFLPSITPQSLQSLDQFLPCISLPVARVSPWMAKRRNDSSKAVSSTGVDDPTPPSLVPFDSDESLLDARSLDCSLCSRKGAEPMLGCFAVWTLKSSILSLRGRKHSII